MVGGSSCTCVEIAAPSCLLSPRHISAELVFYFGRTAPPWMVTEPATPAALAKPARATG